MFRESDQGANAVLEFIFQDPSAAYAEIAYQSRNDRHHWKEVRRFTIAFLLPGVTLHSQHGLGIGVELGHGSLFVLHDGFVEFFIIPGGNERRLFFFESERACFAGGNTQAAADASFPVDGNNLFCLKIVFNRIHLASFHAQSAPIAKALIGVGVKITAGKIHRPGNTADGFKSAAAASAA